MTKSEIAYKLNKAFREKRVRRNQVFLIFANNSRSKQNKKNPEHPFADIGK